MESDEDKEFIHEWRIQNFSHWCAEVHGEGIKSPEFDFSAYCTHMELYPKGISGREEYLVVHLFGGAGSSLSGDLSFHSSNGDLLCSRQTVNGEENIRETVLPPGPKFENVISRIWESEDFITVRCLIRGVVGGEQRMCTTINGLKISWKVNSSLIQEMLLDINNFFHVQLQADYHTYLTIELKICPETDTVNFAIRNDRMSLMNYELPFAVEMCMSLTRSDGTIDRRIKKEHVFRQLKSNWAFEVLQKNELVGKEISLCLWLKTRKSIKSFYSDRKFANDGISIEPSITSNKTEDSVAVLAEDFMCLYQDPKFSDLELKCDGASFPVHRAILSARSPVFNSMLTSGMKEAASGTVDITDLDPSTLGLFLSYLYTGAVEDLQCDSTLKLYYVADKYQVPSLKTKCSKFLSSNVSVSNVCDVLSLADRHRDGELTNVSQNFIMGNYNAVLGSPEWESFVMKEPLLAANTLTQFVVEGSVRKRGPQQGVQPAPKKTCVG